MKKLIVILAIVGLLAIIPLGIALAQTTTQTTPSVPNQSGVEDMIDYCQNMMGSGTMGGGMTGGDMMGGDMMRGGKSGGGMMGGGGGGGRGMMGW